MRFVKPLDAELILELANENDLLVTIEDNARLGGAGSAVNEVLVAQHQTVPVLNLGLPDQFVEHGTREELLAQVGLDTAGVLRAIQKRLRSRDLDDAKGRSEEHTSELQSLMRISYAVFCLKKKHQKYHTTTTSHNVR